MTLKERIEWASKLTPQQHVEFALSNEALELSEEHTFAMWQAAICDLQDALDRDAFEQSGLDFDPDESRPIVAEACTGCNHGAYSEEEDGSVICVKCHQPYDAIHVTLLPVEISPGRPKLKPRQSTFGETFAKIDRQLSRARRLRSPVSDAEMARHAAAFNVPSEVP
jgi:hypothetical protein